MIHARTRLDDRFRHLGHAAAFEPPIRSWGSESLIEAGDLRRRYIDSLRAAEKRSYDKLLTLARSELLQTASTRGSFLHIFIEPADLLPKHMLNRLLGAVTMRFIRQKHQPDRRPIAA